MTLQTMRLTIRLVAVVLGLLALAWLITRPYDRDHREAVLAQLRYLEGRLDGGAAEEMQRLFPEGYVFTWALYGAAAAQTARQPGVDGAQRTHLLTEAERAVAAVRSERARATFAHRMDPPYGAFYTSWSLYVLAEYVRAAGPQHVAPETPAAFTALCDQFAQTLEQSPSPFLASYPGATWPADTTPGIAALGIHDQVLDPRYGPTIARWVSAARGRLAPPLGALSHTAHPSSGIPSGGVRGGSLALMSRLLVEADPAFSREQYALLRAHFLDDLLGLPGLLEYPRGTEGEGDVDTGPLIFGFAGPATVVGAAAARVHGDEALAAALLGTVDVLGFPVEWGGRRRYAGGVMPIGDAFLAWARASPLPDREQGAGMWERKRWFVPFHLLSALLAGLLFWVGYRRVWK